MRSARRMTRARLKAAPGTARRASLATETRSGPPGKAPEITPAKRKASLAKSSVSFCPLQPFEMFDMRNPRFRGFSCFQSFTGRFISRLFFAARIRGRSVLWGRVFKQQNSRIAQIRIFTRKSVDMTEGPRRRREAIQPGREACASGSPRSPASRSRAAAESLRLQLAMPRCSQASPLRRQRGPNYLQSRPALRRIERLGARGDDFQRGVGAA